MKLTFRKEDLDAYRQRYAASTAAVEHAQKATLLKVNLPTYYVLVLDSLHLTVVQQNWTLDEVDSTQIELSEVKNVMVNKVLVIDHIKIQTASQTYKLHVYPLYWRLGDYQKRLIKCLKKLEKKLTE